MKVKQSTTSAKAPSCLHWCKTLEDHRKYIPLWDQFHKMPGRKRTNSLSIIPNSPFWVLHLFEKCSESKWEASKWLQGLPDCGGLQVLVPASLKENSLSVCLNMVGHMQRSFGEKHQCYCYHFYYSYCSRTRINIEMKAYINTIPKKWSFYSVSITLW